VFSDAFWPNPIKVSRFIHRDRPIVDGNVLDLHNQHTSDSKKPAIIGASGVDLTTANFYDPLPHLHATYSQSQRPLFSISLAATITHSYDAPSALLSFGRPSLPNQKHHQLDFFFFVLCNVHQTLTGEALSPDSFKIPALNALFGDVHLSQSKQQQRHQLGLSLSISRDFCQTLSGELLSSYFIKIPALSALFGVVRSSPSNKKQRQLELSLSVLRDIRQTLIDEALSSYSTTLLPLSALFGDVHASQSKQQQHQIEMSLSVSHDETLIIFHQDSCSKRARRSCAIITIEPTTSSAGVVVV